MSPRRKPFRLIVYLLIIASLLGQSISSILISPAQSRGVEASHSPAQAGEAVRPEWERPQSESLTFRPLTPPESLTMPEMPPPFTASDTLQAPPPVPFPLGNNNLGEFYKDSNNFEDHPGRAFAGPVNLINGNFFLTAGDHFFPATGVSIQFARSYNHLAASTSGPLGVGWTHSYSTAVVQENPGTQVVIRNGDGSQHVYTSGDGGLTWNSPAGIFRELFHPPGPATPYMVLHKNGLVEQFTPNGRLQAIIDRSGNAVQMQYDGMNRLTNVVASDGRQLTISYDVFGRISSVQDPIGRQTSYAYDNDNNLVVVNYPEGSAATYTYDASNRMSSYSDPRQPRGAKVVTDIRYDGSDRADYVELGGTTAYTMTYTAGGIDWVDSAGQTARILFDATFNVTFDGAFFAGCACFQGEGYSYYPNMLLQQKGDALGNTTLYEYDSLGNLNSVTSPSGAKTDFDYAGAFSNVISTTNPAGNQTFYEYDGNGNLTAETGPLGRTVTYAYDPAGNLLSQTDPAGGLTSYTYDPAGNLLSLTPPGVGPTTFTYDVIGRVTTKTDPNGGVTAYAYDASDRLLLVTDPIGGTIQYQYDSHDNLVQLTDQNGQVISYAYDALDRVLSATDPLGGTATYAYDEVGRLSVRTDSMGATTAYLYDEVSRLLQRTYSDGLVENYAYDPVGRLILTTDNTSYTRNMTYDSEGRVTGYIYDAGFSSPTSVIITYDPVGNRNSVEVDDGTTDFVTTYEYDTLYRLTRTTGDDGRQWDTTYDALDRRQTSTEPDNSHVE
jgi:YD repeat-containing protein